MGIRIGSDFALLTGIIIWTAIRGLILLMNKKYRMISLHRELLLNIFAVYLGFVLSLTIFPISIIWSGARTAFQPSVNIKPFIDVFRDFSFSHLSLSFRIRTLIINLVGNLVLLLPLGIFAPMLWPELRSFKRIVIIGALVSLSIELLQYVLAYLGYGMGRATDIDDLILNVLGVMIGYMIYSKILKRFNVYTRAN